MSALFFQLWSSMATLLSPSHPHWPRVGAENRQLVPNLLTSLCPQSFMHFISPHGAIWVCSHWDLTIALEGPSGCREGEKSYWEVLGEAGSGTIAAMGEFECRQRQHGRVARWVHWKGHYRQMGAYQEPHMSSLGCKSPHIPLHIMELLGLCL